MIEPGDLTAIDLRIDAAVEQAERRAWASAANIVGQAYARRGGADDFSRGLSQLAEDVEVGNLPIPREGVVMVMLPAEVAEDVVGGFVERTAGLPEDDERQVVMPITTANGDDERGRILIPLQATVGGEALDFTPQMKAWLGEFDDRIRTSPHFVRAVNEAADAHRPLTIDTARLVGQRVQELGEHAAAAAPTDRETAEAPPRSSGGMRARSAEEGR